MPSGQPSDNVDAAGTERAGEGAPAAQRTGRAEETAVPESPGDPGAMSSTGRLPVPPGMENELGGTEMTETTVTTHIDKVLTNIQQNQQRTN